MKNNINLNISTNNLGLVAYLSPINALVKIAPPQNRSLILPLPNSKDLAIVKIENKSNRVFPISKQNIFTIKFNKINQIQIIRNISVSHSKINPNQSVKRREWNHWKSDVEYSIITEDILIKELERFIEFYNKNLKEYPGLAIQLKIEFEPGFYRSLTKIQILLFSEIRKFHALFSLIYEREVLLESNQQIKSLHGRVLFFYKPMKEISESKLFIDLDKKHITNLQGDYTKVWTYKNLKIPANMFLKSWPGINFIDKSLAISTQNLTDGSQYQLVIKIYENFHSVTVLLNNKKILMFKDYMLDKGNLSTFKREISENYEIIEDVKEIDGTKSKKVVYSKELKDFSLYINGIIKLRCMDKKGKFMPKAVVKGYNFTSNFMTMDLETRTNSIGKMIPICLSVYDGKEVKTFFFKTNDPTKEISLVVKEYMKRKNYGKRIYLHNFSKFDAVFMVDALSTLGEIDLVTREGNILELKLKFDYDEKRKKYLGQLIFRDSMLILPGGLRKLSKSFNVENKKSFFPLKLLLDENFSWGIKYNTAPPRSLFTDYEGNYLMTEKEYQDYSKNFNSKDQWIFKNELQKYCELDVISLHQILTIYGKLLWEKFDVNIINHCTLPAIAFQIYRMHHLEKYTIPLIYKHDHDDIKAAYYGGISEAYRAYGENIHSYDVNSLYPASMNNNDMPVGLPRKFFGDPFLHNKDPFGFFYVKVTAPESLKIPILPHRIKLKDGYRTICPVGTWSGWYFSEEIKNAKKYGYKFEVIQGFTFEKQNVFSSYVNELYKLKSSHDSWHPMYSISKLLLNSLYGRFGMNPFTEKTILCSEKESNEIVLQKEVSNIVKLISGKLLVTYIERIDEEYDEDSSEQLKISIPIAAAITAYSRIHMSHFLTKYSDNILAMDTDGIKIDKHLDDDEIDNKKLGMMKYEYTFKKAVFPAPKMYAGNIDNPKDLKEEFIVKLKGFKAKISYFALMLSLYKDSNVIKIQEIWKRNFGESYIAISKQPYLVNHSDSKREIIYDGSGKFIDSLPLLLDNGAIKLRNPYVIHFLPLFMHIIPYTLRCTSPEIIILLPSPHYSIVKYLSPILEIEKFTIPFTTIMIPEKSLVPYVIYIHPLAITSYIIYIPTLSITPYVKPHVSILIYIPKI